VNPLTELSRLTSLFPDEPLIAIAEHVAGSLVPQPYRRILVHEHHMTVTMEEFHGCAVDVKVLNRKREGDIYSRKILLTKQGTDDVVLFGIVRFDFQYVTPVVREEIVSESTPLGSVLIKHNVLRHIDLGAVIRIAPAPALARYLRMKDGVVTYGRLATIFCNKQPAVDLLEISIPLAVRE
jgi:hypothetical protein